MSKITSQLILTLIEALTPVISQGLLMMFGALAEILTDKKEEGADESQLSSFVFDVVSSLEKNHPQWTGEEKFTMALDEIRWFANAHGFKETKTSTLRALVELAVQRVTKETSGK